MINFICETIFNFFLRPCEHIIINNKASIMPLEMNNACVLTLYDKRCQYEENSLCDLTFNVFSFIIRMRDKIFKCENCSSDDSEHVMCILKINFQFSRTTKDGNFSETCKSRYFGEWLKVYKPITLNSSTAFSK